MKGAYISPMSEAGRYAPQESSRQCAIRELAGLLKPSEKAKYTIGRQQRRARQDAYRRELDEQVADEGERRKGDARKIREIEGRHELQSATYNPWGKPGCGAPLRQADGTLVTNVKAYHRAKLQGLIPQDLSPNEIGENEQPFGFSLTSEGTTGSDSTGVARRPSKQASMSSSPPRNRYRFDRLPPEEQAGIDRRMKQRQELEAALLCQVEEKRALKDREVAAKRREDETERDRVLKILAEERAANPSRVRDKNLRAGEALSAPHTTGGSGGPSARHVFGEAVPESDMAAARRNPHEANVKTRRRHRLGDTESSTDSGAGFVGGLRAGDKAERRNRGVGAVGDYSLAGGATGPGAVGDEDKAQQRERVLLILRKLEDHGKMLERLASELATVKASQELPTNQAGCSGDRSSTSPTQGLGGASPRWTHGNFTGSSLSPLFRTFQQDEDQLDRLLQRFGNQGQELPGGEGVLYSLHSPPLDSFALNEY